MSAPVLTRADVHRLAIVCHYQPCGPEPYEPEGDPALVMLLRLQYEPQPGGPALCRGCGCTSNPGCAPDCEVAAAIQYARGMEVSRG